MSDTIDRRDFVAAAAGTVALGLAGRPASPTPRPAPTALFAAPPLATVRVGFVGVGHQGMSHVENLLKLDGVEIKAICDINPTKVAQAQQLATDAGRPAPTGYGKDSTDFRRLCEAEELDLVYTATPWEWHAPVCLAAMRSGKHAATEVPMCVTLDECWELVETAEQTQRHCVMMENCCYDRTEMMILNLVRRGALGELRHAECGYLHDLRELKLTDYYEGRWRIQHSIRRNGDLYPTHGLGPVAQWLDVNRGNRFDHLVSVATKSGGLNRWAATHVGERSAEARQRYALGDIVNTFIKTAAGQTILVTHDTNSPRPYSRRILLQGTQGVVRKYPEEKIHLEGRSPAHQWEDLAAYRDEFEHTVWRELEERSKGAGHGGMDFIEDFRLVAALREGRPTDLDVYDGAAVTAVSALSEQSIRGGSRPVVCPDFTRGAWKTRPRVEIA